MAVRSFRPVLAVGMVAAVMAVAILAGCGGGGSNDNPVTTGGTIAGRTVDAETNIGLGGVTVEVGTGAAVRTAVSTTPNGDFAIREVTPGTYTSLHVIPDPALFGAGSDFYVDKLSLVVVKGGVAQLPAAIVITEGGPPTPP